MLQGFCGVQAAAKRGGRQVQGACEQALSRDLLFSRTDCAYRQRQQFAAAVSVGCYGSVERGTWWRCPASSWATTLFSIYLPEEGKSST